MPLNLHRRSVKVDGRDFARPGRLLFTRVQNSILTTVGGQTYLAGGRYWRACENVQVKNNVIFDQYTRAYTPKVYIHVYTPTSTPRYCSVAVTTVTTVFGPHTGGFKVSCEAVFCLIARKLVMVHFALRHEAMRLKGQWDVHRFARLGR